MADVNMFAGAGGMAIGLGKAGFSPLQLYEIDPYSCETLRHNSLSATPTLACTVHNLNVAEMDWRHVRHSVRLLVAGTPCQPFSLGGKHKAQHDGRNLFPEVFRAIRDLRPAAVLLENVRGLLRSTFRSYFEYILRQLECPSTKPRAKELWQSHDQRIRRHQCSVNYSPEYQVAWRLLDAADFGIPQNRQRVFIVATRSDLPVYTFPLATHSREALLTAQSSGEYWERRGLPIPSSLPRNGASREPAQGLRPWLTVRDALKTLPEPAEKEAISFNNHWVIPGARTYSGHKGSILDWPSKTVKAGVHGVPGGENTLIGDDGRVRYYTLRETARLQTFPNNHIFVGARMHITRQIGNAVPCRVAEIVARPLFELLKKWR